MELSITESPCTKYFRNYQANNICNMCRKMKMQIARENEKKNYN